MWEFKIYGFDFFYLFYSFFIYSFLGWIYETTLVSVRSKRFVNRGFLNGAIIPIYGVGAVSVYVMLYPVRHNILLVYFAGLLVATIIEYITSYLMEVMFHAKWWDYSQYKFNISGRVCLQVSLFWGVLSILMTNVFQPIVDFIIKGLSNQFGRIGGYVLLILFLFDFILTFVSTIQLDKKLADIQKIRQDLSDFIEGIKLFDTKEELRVKFENNRILEVIDNIKLKLEVETDKYMNSKTNKDKFYSISMKEEVEVKLKEFLSKFQKKTNGPHIIHKRLLKAFPDLKSVKKESALKDLKEKLHIKKNK